MVGETRPNGVGEIHEKDVEQQDQAGDEKEESMYQQVCASIKKWELALELIQWSSLVSLTGLLIAILVINKLRKTEIWEVELWRTCVFVLVIFGGYKISRWLKDGVLFFIVKSRDHVNRKFAYLMYVIINSSTIVIWFGLILVVWLVLIRGRLEKSFSSQYAEKVLHTITRVMICILVGLSLWYLKTYAIKLIDSSFKMNKFFSRVQDAIVYKYFVQELKKFETGNKIKEAEYLKWENVRRLSETVEGEADAVSMTQLIEKLSILNKIEITRTKFEEKPKTEADNEEMTFTKLQYVHKHEHDKHEHEHDKIPRYIDTEKLKTALQNRMPCHKVLSLFEGNEDRKILKSDFREWMNEAEEELRCLAMTFQSSNTAIDELSSISGVVVIVIILIVWSLVMEIMTTEVLVLVTSQLLVWSFIFSDTVKTVFEGIIFNFVTHPLDVGDECKIDDKEKMIVEEMGLLSTNFKANRNEKGEVEEQKVYYSNLVLAQLRISNLSKTSSKMEERRIWTRKKQA